MRKIKNLISEYKIKKWLKALELENKPEEEFWWAEIFRNKKN